MKITVLLLSFFLAHACPAQFKLTKLDEKSIPGNIPYGGKLIEAIRWTDNTGNHIVVLSSTGKTETAHTTEEGFSDGALFANHYLVSTDSIKQTWKVQDYIKECPVDMFLHFVDGSFAVTDLDKNGQAEVWMMYKISCQGDVSPVPMKIIMYHDNRKFAARGTTRVKVSENEYMGGEFTFDEAFRKAPPGFRQYAEKLWIQYRDETWEE